MLQYDPLVVPKVFADYQFYYIELFYGFQGAALKV